MDLEKIKAVQEFKEQCDRYGVAQTDVARDCNFNVRSFQVAIQNACISQKRLDKAFKSLQKLVTRKGIEYTVRKAGLDPNTTKKKLVEANA